MLVKTIIFCIEPKLLWFYKRFNIFVRGTFSPKKNITSVRSDIFSASDYRYCDHLASCAEDELIDILVKNQYYKFLHKWGGDTYARYFIGIGVIEHARNVFESFNYANQVYSKFNLQGRVYIFPLNFSLRIYKEMKKMGLLPDHIKIHYLAKSYLRLYNFIKFMYFLLRIVLYPEILILKAKNQQNIKKYKYRNCVHLYDGLFESPLINNTVIKNEKVFSLFNDKDTLYIDDRFRNFQKWTNQLNNTDKYAIRLEDVVAEISKAQYIKRFYLSAFKWRCKLFILLLRHPFLVKGCSRAIRERILWDIFYHKFSIKNAIRIMVKENLTSSIVHKYNNTKTTFIYFSSTEEIVAQVKDKGCSTCHDYTHMIFDNVISSDISNNWLQTLENSVEKYITIGPVFSDLITSLYCDKKAICDKLNIYQNAKIVSFLDHSVGYIGVMTVESHLLFVKGMLMLARENPDIYFFFKSKKSLSRLKVLVGEDILRLMNSVEKMSNCFYANEFDLTSYDVMNISDLVVSAPMSSIIFESLCGGVKTISFDPLSQYVNYDVVTNKFPNFNAVNYTELQELVNYWIFQCTNQDFEIFLSNYIKSSVDQKCCENSMIDSLKEILYV